MPRSVIAKLSRQSIPQLPPDGNHCARRDRSRATAARASPAIIIALEPSCQVRFKVVENLAKSRNQPPDLEAKQGTALANARRMSAVRSSANFRNWRQPALSKAGDRRPRSSRGRVEARPWEQSVEGHPYGGDLAAAHDVVCCSLAPDDSCFPATAWAGVDQLRRPVGPPERTEIGCCRRDDRPLGPDQGNGTELPPKLCTDPLSELGASSVVVSHLSGEAFADDDFAGFHCSGRLKACRHHVAVA